MKKLRHTFLSRLNDDSEYPILAGVATGLYPFISYYTHNFQLVNSWSHFLFFTGLFIVAPALLFLFLYRISKQEPLKKWRKYGLFFLTIFVFLLFAEISVHAQLKKKLALATFVAVIPFSFFLYKDYKKFIALQFLLAFIGLFSLVPKMMKYANISMAWLQQPDAIEEIVLKKKPNIYFIQPDGYVNFEEVAKGHYEIDNDDFRSFLKSQNFKEYANFRSSYPSTLASNTAIFSMKHHYFNYGTHPSAKLKARKTLVSENSVLHILKNNGYKTHLILEAPYILLNRPKMGYDACNFGSLEVPFIGSGFRRKRDVQVDLEEQIKMEGNQPKFFFIEIFNPGHIANNKSGTKGSEIEKDEWKESLKYANRRLTTMLTTIEENDPNALVILLSDHAGYVGLEYSREMYRKTSNRDDIYSLFASLCAIKWPNGENPTFDTELKSSVNVFRIIFAELSEDLSLLNSLQNDGSYCILNKGVPQKGPYRYIDNAGAIVCEFVGKESE